MRFTMAFIALLALTPVLGVPVPTPTTEPNTIEALVASAKVNDIYNITHDAYFFTGQPLSSTGEDGTNRQGD